jgi:hypothetical protein
MFLLIDEIHCCQLPGKVFLLCTTLSPIAGYQTREFTCDNSDESMYARKREWKQEAAVERQRSNENEARVTNRGVAVYTVTKLFHLEAPRFSIIFAGIMQRLRS